MNNKMYSNGKKNINHLDPFNVTTKSVGVLKCLFTRKMPLALPSSPLVVVVVVVVHLLHQSSNVYLPI